jgi:hypothetical protein
MYISLVTAKQIWYSHHARLMLRARGFTRRDVRWLLAQGVATDLGGNVYDRRGYLRKKEVSLIYHENATRILVITIQEIE